MKPDYTCKHSSVVHPDLDLDFLFQVLQVAPSEVGVLNEIDHVECQVQPCQTFVHLHELLLFELEAQGGHVDLADRLDLHGLLVEAELVELPVNFVEEGDDVPLLLFRNCLEVGYLSEKNHHFSLVQLKICDAVVHGAQNEFRQEELQYFVRLVLGLLLLVLEEDGRFMVLLILILDQNGQDKVAE